MRAMRELVRSRNAYRQPVRCCSTPALRNKQRIMRIAAKENCRRHG
jgi:hypothetical protein